ncbi:MAG: hypothetical protein OHK0013_44650 [Sandaracinaceae bacterium]
MSGAGRRATAASVSLAVVLLALGARGQSSELARAAPGHALGRFDGLAHAPFPPVASAPQALVHWPLDARGPADVVLYLHGYEGCVEVLAAEGPSRCRPGARIEQGWDLLAAHAEARVPSWLVMPQLAFRTRDGSPGRLAREGEARLLLDEALARASAGAVPTVRSVVLVAHSAAFESAIAVLRRGGLGATLRHVVLLDAMYSGVPVFAEWAASNATHSLVAFHTAGGTPERRARELVSRYGRRLGARLRAGDAVSEQDVAPGRVVLARARTTHRGVPRRYLGPTLARLLGASEATPPR